MRSLRFTVFLVVLAAVSVYAYLWLQVQTDKPYSGWRKPYPKTQVIGVQLSGGLFERLRRLAPEHSAAGSTSGSSGGPTRQRRGSNAR